MRNSYTLRIYPKAQADLDNIFCYISENLRNPTAAVSLIDEIEHSLDLVCQNPEMCPTVRSSLIKDDTLRKLVVKNYIVFYRPMKDMEEIQVIRVLYGMMDYESIL